MQQQQQQEQQASPLTSADVANVLTCLQAALSSDPQVQKQAEGQLSAIESRTGFCSCLAVSATILPAVHLQCRFLSQPASPSPRENQQQHHTAGPLSHAAPHLVMHPYQPHIRGKQGARLVM